jgi:hypothetical protein
LRASARPPHFAPQTLKFSAGCVHLAHASFFTTDNTDRSAPDKSTAMQTFLSVPGAERRVFIVVALSGGPIREIRGKICGTFFQEIPRSRVYFMEEMIDRPNLYDGTRPPERRNC